MSRVRSAEANSIGGARARGRPPVDSVSMFASDLRELRHESGNPTLHALARATDISKSVVSEALMGRRMPTENTTARLVDALGGDVSEWMQRRAALLHSAESESPVPARPIPAPTRTRRRLMIASLLFMLGAVALIFAIWRSAEPHTLAGLPSDEASTRSRPVATHLPPAPRADPAHTICAEDAVVATAQQRLGGTVLVTLMYSAQCDAVWGLLAKTGDQLDGRSVTIDVFPAADRYGGRNVSATVVDTAAVTTSMISGSSQLAGVCAEVRLTSGADGFPMTDTPVCVGRDSG